MEKKGVSQYRLIKSGVDNRTIDSLKNNRNITMNTLEKICKIINCTPNDVVRFK
jgi:DNA-binding Xre family transcriptional regulator